MAARKSVKKGVATRKTFVLCLQRHGINILSENTPGVSAVIGIRQYLAEATAYIDYGCDFKKGKCRRDRRRGPTEYWDGCCCKGCLEFVGYFTSIPEIWIEKLVQLWDPSNNGFYDVKSGCRIPRHMRPSACLAHQCATANNNHKLAQVEYLVMCAIKACRI